MDQNNYFKNKQQQKMNPLDPQLAHSRVCGHACRAADDVGRLEQLGFLAREEKLIKSEKN